jgi:hypothetical protein
MGTRLPHALSLMPASPLVSRIVEVSALSIRGIIFEEAAFVNSKAFAQLP